MKIGNGKQWGSALGAAALTIVGLAGGMVYAAARAQQPAAGANSAPRKVVGNVYALGTPSASFLVVTPQGDILINSGLERDLPSLQKAIEQLGFKLSDIKIVLGTDARPEEREADALLKQRTGAQVMAVADDVPPLQNVKPGGKAHPMDKTLHDGDQIALGGAILVAHLAPGRTPGAANWALKATDGGKMYDVTILGSGQQPGYTMVATSVTTPGAPASPAPTAAAGAAPAGGGGAASVTANDPALAARGKDRYHAYACFDCHGQNGEGTEDAPDLVGTHLDAGQIAAFLNKPSADALAKGMPNVPSNSPDLAPLVAYVLSMKKNP